MEPLQYLGFVGLLISLYFLLVYKGFLGSSETFLPKKICSKGSCHDLLKTGFSKVFRVPNFILGIVYYTLIILYQFLPFLKPMFAPLGVFVALFSIYLAYALVFKLKTSCVLCFASHIINVTIAAVFIA